MEEVRINISSIDWWFNGLFFIMIGAVIPFLFLKVFPFMGRVFIFKPLRSIKAKRLKRIKKIRWSSLRVSHESAKCAAFLGAFLISSVVYLISMFIAVAVISSVQGEGELIDNLLFFRVVEFSMVVVFIIEVVYLKQKIFLNSLLYRFEMISPRP